MPKRSWSSWKIVVLGLEVADLEGAEVLPHALELGDLLVEATCGCCAISFSAASLTLLLLVGLGALFLERGELLLQLAAGASAMRESRRSPSVFISRRMLFSCVGQVARDAPRRRRR